MMICAFGQVGGRQAAGRGKEEEHAALGDVVAPDKRESSAYCSTKA